MSIIIMEFKKEFYNFKFYHLNILKLFLEFFEIIHLIIFNFL